MEAREGAVANRKTQLNNKWVVGQPYFARGMCDALAGCIHTAMSIAQSLVNGGPLVSLRRLTKLSCSC